MQVVPIPLARKRPVWPDARKHYVYILFREDGRPFYVGKGTGQRWKEHEKPSYQERWKTQKDHIIAAMQAAGLEIPKVKLGEGLTNEEASALEILFIAAIGRQPAGPLVNLTDGGEGKAPSAITRAKRSAALKGRVLSPEWREKMRQAKLGKKLTPEHKERIRASNIGIAKPKSPEHRQKLSEALKGRPNPHAAGPRSPEHQKNLSEALIEAWDRRKERARCK